MGFISAITFWLSYFAPSLIAWHRVKNGKPIVGSIGSIVVINFLIGWTVVGWLVMLANAFGYNPVAWFVLRYGKHLTTSAPGPAGSQGGLPPSGTPPATLCGQCSGSGFIKCSTCSGRGSWYNPPSGESGVAQLQTCTACSSSGRLRCPYCGGSGHAARGLG
jgi:hypothetical protein